MDSNVPMMVYDNLDYVFTWNGGQYVYVYEGTMTDSDNRAASTPLSIIELVGGQLHPRGLTLEAFGDLCDQWAANRERDEAWLTQQREDAETEVEA